MAQTVQTELIDRLADEGLVDFTNTTQTLGLALFAVYAYAYATKAVDPEQALRKLNQWVANEEIQFRRGYSEFVSDIEDLLLGQAAAQLLTALGEALGLDTPEADTFA